MRRLDSTVGLLFLGAGALVAVVGFSRLGHKVRDAVVLEEYLVPIAVGEQRSFGYGGEDIEDRVDIPFQSREMNDLSFIILRENERRFVIWAVGGEFDRVFLGGTWHPATERVVLHDGDRFINQGVLGRAVFKVKFPTASENRLRLQMDTPVFREIATSTGRLSFGLTNVPVPTSVDEVFFRVPPLPTGTPQHFRISVQPCGLKIEPEHDWAESITQQSSKDWSRCLKHGDPFDIGTVRVSFRHTAGRVQNVLGGHWNRTELFGYKLTLAVLLFACAFYLGPQLRLRGGSTIFGCAFFLISVGLVLAGRDFFFEPHRPQLLATLKILFASAVLLFHLRVPIVMGPGDNSRSRLVTFAFSYVLFIAAWSLMDEPFDGSNYSIWPGLKALLILPLLFVVALLISNGFLLACRGALGAWSDAGRTRQQFLRVWFIGVLVPLVLILAGRLSGRTEAIALPGFRIYLPTLLLPLAALTVALLLWTAETEVDKQNAMAMRLFSVLCPIVPLAIYRVLSGDNGGTALVALAVLATMWLGSKTRTLPTAVTVIVLIGGWFVANLNQSSRIELAWGDQEKKMLYYDQSRNLRTARDMARSGGISGLGVNLPLPVVVRSNIHSDLVACYVAGYFGWPMLAAVLLALLLLYNTLLHGIRTDLLAKLLGSKNADARAALATFAASVVLIAALQALWVAAASLQSSIPLTGQDLQPISSSSNSIVSFLLLLVGSSVIAHNVGMPTTEKE